MSTGPTPAPSRRDFCASSCRTLAALAAGTLAGCGGSSTSPSDPSELPTVAASVNGRAISVDVGAAPALANVGAAALAQTLLGPFLVLRTAADAFTALTAVCTHEGCTVSEFGQGRFTCPCHGSQYNTNGVVTNGPATRALQAYPTQFVNGVLTFTI